MKSRRMAAAAFFVLLAGAVWLCAAGKRPFKGLDASEIVSAAVHLTPPDKTVRIADTEVLAELLRDVVIYRRDPSYTGYTGQGVTFRLAMEDGTQAEIMAFNPFLVIDGAGYRTKYGPCEALSSYANRLLGEEDAVIILEGPPPLTVVSGLTAHTAELGAYSWQSMDDRGAAQCVKEEGVHPLLCREKLLPPLETEERAVTLRFSEEPDTVLRVRCWSDSCWGDPFAEGETVECSGNEVILRPGGYIYETEARWDAESGCGGTARYSFYIKAAEGRRGEGAAETGDSALSRRPADCENAKGNWE